MLKKPESKVKFAVQVRVTKRGSVVGLCENGDQLCVEHFRQRCLGSNISVTSDNSIFGIKKFSSSKCSLSFSSKIIMSDKIIKYLKAQFKHLHTFKFSEIPGCVLGGRFSLSVLTGSVVFLLFKIV